MSQRTKTEVLREMLRGLKDATPAHTAEPEPERRGQDATRSRTPKNAPQTLAQVQNHADDLHPKKSLKVSSRNVLEGKVKRIVKGSIHTEVTLEIVHLVELTSTITTTSAETLELAEGKVAYAVIKSSDVVIAME
jgi:molybdopterin-binding protein